MAKRLLTYIVLYITMAGLAAYFFWFLTQPLRYESDYDKASDKYLTTFDLGWWQTMFISSGPEAQGVSKDPFVLYKDQENYLMSETISFGPCRLGRCDYYLSNAKPLTIGQWSLKRGFSVALTISFDKPFGVLVFPTATLVSFWTVALVAVNIGLTYISGYFIFKTKSAGETG